MMTALLAERRAVYGTVRPRLGSFEAAPDGLVVKP
jgi:hypothetical protein